MRGRIGFWLLWLVVVFQMVPAVATAQPSTGEAPTLPGQHRVSGAVDIYSGNSVTMFAPAFYGRFRLYDARGSLAGLSGRGGFVVDLDVAWRGVGLAGDVGIFRMGNPFVGVRFGKDSRAFTIRFGGGITLPLINLYDDGFEAFTAYGVGRAVHGFWDLELLTPQSMSVLFYGDAQYRASAFTLGGDAGFSTLINVPEGGPSGDPVLLFKLGVYGAALPIPELALGLRFQMVALVAPGGGGGEDGYLAMVPFIRGQFGQGFAEVRLWMNLDEPLGFAFDSGKFWAISFSGGGNF